MALCVHEQSISFLVASVLLFFQSAILFPYTVKKNFFETSAMGICIRWTRGNIYTHMYTYLFENLYLSLHTSTLILWLILWRRNFKKINGIQWLSWEYISLKLRAHNTKNETKIKQNPHRNFIYASYRPCLILSV